MLCWYAVHTRSNFEKKLSDELTRKGLEVFLPTFQKVIYPHGKKEVLELPLFRGYTFTRMDETPDSRLIVLGTNGALRILGKQQEGEPIPDPEVQSLKVMVESKLQLTPMGFLPKLGSLILVKRGPLAGVEGTLLRKKNETRVVVAISLMGSTSAEVDLDDIELVKAA